jgi:ribosomal protein S8
LKALQEGAYIKHFQYGLGVVTESDSERTLIEFDLHGPKKFVTSIMVVEAAEGTPPKRKRAKRAKKVAKVDVGAVVVETAEAVAAAK